MTRRQAAGGGELFAVGGAAGVLAPGQLAGILVQIRTGDMMMLADLGAAQPGEIAFRLIGTGTIHAVGATVVDASHLVPRVKIIPGARLVGMDDTASGDTLPDDRHGLGFSRRDDRRGRTAALAHHHDAAALSILVFAPTPVDPLKAVVAGADMAAEPRSIDLDHAAQGEFRRARKQGATEFVEQDEGGFGVTIEIPTYLEAADPLDGVDEQVNRQQQDLKW